MDQFRPERCDLEDDVFKATMNVQLMDEEHVGDDIVIFDPDTVEDPPEGATLDDYALTGDEIMIYVEQAAEIRRGFKNIREQLGAHDHGPVASGRFDNLQVSDELNHILRRN